DHFVSGEEFGKNVERPAVVRIIKGGNQDETVGNVEVAIAGGQTLALEDDRSRHGQLHNLEGLAMEVAGGPEAIEILSKRQMVLVVDICLSHGHDLVFRNEAGNVIDVAVGVVAGNAAVQPQDLVNAQVI